MDLNQREVLRWLAGNALAMLPGDSTFGQDSGQAAGAEASETVRTLMLRSAVDFTPAQIFDFTSRLSCLVREDQCDACVSYRRTLERHLVLAITPDRVEQLIRASFPGIETCDKCRDKTVDGLNSALGLTLEQACDLWSRLNWILGQFRCDGCDEYCRVLYRRLPLATTFVQVEQVMESFPQREACHKCREAIDKFRYTHGDNLALPAGYVTPIEEGFMRYCKAQGTPYPRLPPRPLQEEMPSPKTQCEPLPPQWPFLPSQEEKPSPETQRKPLPRLPQVLPRSLEEEMPSSKTQRTALPQLPPRSPPTTSEPETSKAPTFTHPLSSRNPTHHRPKGRERRARKRARRREEGLCTQCGRERDSHWKMCKYCRGLAALRRRRKSPESQAGEASQPRTYLHPKVKEARDQRRREGVCTGCGRERDSHWKTCKHCRGISARKYHRKLQKRKQPSLGNQEETEIAETADT